MKTKNYTIFDMANQARIYPMNGLTYAPIQCLAAASEVNDGAEAKHSGLQVGDVVFGVKVGYLSAIGVINDVFKAGDFYDTHESAGIDWWPAGYISIPPIMQKEIHAAFDTSKDSGLIEISPLLGEALNMLAPTWFTHHQKFGNKSAYEQMAHAQRTLAILARNDIVDAKKLALLDALNGVGEFGKAVRSRQPTCPFLQENSPDSRVVHIRPWDDCTDEQRLDPENGVLLGAEYAQYFTSGYISFMESGQYYFNDAIDFDIFRGCRGGEDNFALRAISSEQEAYLQFHRTYVFENWLIQGHCVLMDFPPEMLAAEKGWIPRQSGEGYVFKGCSADIADRVMEGMLA